MSRILIKNGHLITMDPQRRQLAADLLIDGDRIVEMAAQIEASADDVIDATGGLVLPGFVQSHIHLCQSLFRGQADDQPLLDWL
ncbi:MAG: N-ethylammeline chlorohydrolase, partial [Acidimicrobiia bacterium]|nr:N-ethylammeline chlorohydrolase [Acidimicrobiia bacterium]